MLMIRPSRSHVAAAGLIGLQNRTRLHAGSLCCHYDCHHSIGVQLLSRTVLSHVMDTFVSIIQRCKLTQYCGRVEFLVCSRRYVLSVEQWQ